MGTDAGYTLVLKNQYISYGLDDTMFETYLTKISEYYTGFELTPMSFTLAEPDFDLHVGDRIQVYDEEEQVTICNSFFGSSEQIDFCFNGFNQAGFI